MASQEVGLAQVFDSIKSALDSHNYLQAEQILMPALDQYPELPQLWYYAGTLFFQVERLALSVQALKRSVELEPAAVSYSNLGAALRRMGRHEEALAALKRAAEIEDNNASTWNNIGACWVNEGGPENGLPAVNKAIELKPGFARAHWNKALLELELGNFGVGWDEYRWGIGHDRILRDYGDDVDYLPQDLSELQYFARKADGTWHPTFNKLIVYGEQGLGDELMMASLLFRASEDFAVTFDCHPRLEPIYRRCLPENVEIHPTRKVPIESLDWLEDWKARPGAQFCISIADLGSYYTRKYQDYTGLWQRWGPFWQPDEKLTSEYRGCLEEVAEGRKIIGLATRGGHIKTARYYRTIRPHDLEPLLKDDRYFFVAMDYENVDGMVQKINEKYGEGTMAHFRAVNHHFNFDHTFALAAATDAVVTVCQTLFHVSAGMGHPTLCLVPDKPAWRYGAKGRKHFWYQGRSTRLFRQPPGEGWEKPVRELAKTLETSI